MLPSAQARAQLTMWAVPAAPMMVRANLAQLTVGQLREITDPALLAISQALAVRRIEVGVRDVPPALVEGPVSARAEPVAERRDGVGRQPEHLLGVVGGFRESVGLRDAVQGWVVSCQQRRAARRDAADIA